MKTTKRPAWVLRCKRAFIMSGDMKKDCHSLIEYKAGKFTVRMATDEMVEGLAAVGRGKSLGEAVAKAWEALQKLDPTVPPSGDKPGN